MNLRRKTASNFALPSPNFASPCVTMRRPGRWLGRLRVSLNFACFRLFSLRGRNFFCGSGKCQGVAAATPYRFGGAVPPYIGLYRVIPPFCGEVFSGRSREEREEGEAFTNIRNASRGEEFGRLAVGGGGAMGHRALPKLAAGSHLLAFARVCSDFCRKFFYFHIWGENRDGGGTDAREPKIIA